MSRPPLTASATASNIFVDFHVTFVHTASALLAAKLFGLLSRCLLPNTAATEQAIERYNTNLAQGFMDPGDWLCAVHNWQWLRTALLLAHTVHVYRTSGDCSNVVPFWRLSLDCTLSTSASLLAVFLVLRAPVMVSNLSVSRLVGYWRGDMAATSAVKQAMSGEYKAATTPTPIPADPARPLVVSSCGGARPTGATRRLQYSLDPAFFGVHKVNKEGP